MRHANNSQISWKKLARNYTVDYVALLILTIILVISEELTPFTKVFYTKNDKEYWRYSYPLHEKNTVPAWTVPLIATAGPLIVIAVSSLVFKPTRLELHNIILGLFSAVLITATLTNLIKLGVGRPRPNFMARCWPDGALKFTDAGIPDCNSDAVDPGEGRKSFPSGHTSWSTSGMGYLTFWLAGQLRCFDGNGHPSRLIIAALPLCFAGWIGITRLQDYWHHWEDVMAGFLLGLTVAYLCYRQHFHAIMSKKSGEAYQVLEPSGFDKSMEDIESGLGLTHIHSHGEA